MVFNSYIFILVFLPIFTVLYFLAERTVQNGRKAVIIAGGIIFYVYAGWDIASILGCSILVNLFFAHLISPPNHPPKNGL